MTQRARSWPTQLLAVFALIAPLALTTEVEASGPTGGQAASGDGTPTEDPRVLIVELKIGRQHPEALANVEQVLAERPEDARRLGLDYLRGRLLLQLDRRQEALEAFAATLSATPALEPYGRYRLAREQAQLDYPQVAAGLLATLLSGNPPPSLVRPAMRLLRRAIEEGGDCRLLPSLERRRFPTSVRRQLLAAIAACAERNDAPQRAQQIWLDLLEADQDDQVARLAAEALATRGPEKKSARTHMLIGLGFYAHREFGEAIHHLARALVQLPGTTDIRRNEVFELRYALARSHFWEGRYTASAGAFDALASFAIKPEERAQVLYQKARSLELDGRWDAARATFGLAYSAEPNGDWASAALISRMRLAWLGGAESDALKSLQSLITARKYSRASRALLFLAITDLVEGRADRAGAWLASAERLGRLPRPEMTYWRGRLQELEGAASNHLEPAVLRYLETIQAAPFHPLAMAARRRLETPELASTARQIGQRFARGDRLAGFYAAWVLLGDEDAVGAQARQHLLDRLERDPAAAPFLRLGSAPAASWPLWNANLDQPEEMLLALGLFDEGASVVMRHFPVARPTLAFTGSLALARSGETRRSLYIAEILRKRVPGQMPPQLLPEAYRQLLFPFAYRHLIVRESNRWQVDPFLLAGIIREESRFDPEAFSAASARGLTQFVFSTARELARDASMVPIAPHDLEEPEVAITLGAAYLHHLDGQFDGFEPQVIAAYNAGEPQAALWRRYCRSDEPEEYLSKVAFQETRGYLTKVLTSRAQYADLYSTPNGLLSNSAENGPSSTGE